MINVTEFPRIERTGHARKKTNQLVNLWGLRGMFFAIKSGDFNSLKDEIFSIFNLLSFSLGINYYLSILKEDLTYTFLFNCFSNIRYAYL
jgi:hypothetical protein